MLQLLKTRHCIIFRLVLHCLLTFPKVLFKFVNHFPLLLQNFLIHILVLKLKIQALVKNPKVSFKFKFDSHNTEQAQRQEAFNSPSLTLPTSFHKYNASRMRPAPSVVIQKFNGDPMEYWLFVRHLLLHQYCESHVQSNFSYVSNQSLSKSMGHSS